MEAKHTRHCDTTCIRLVCPCQRRQPAEKDADARDAVRQQRILQSVQWNLCSLWWKQNWMLLNQDAALYFGADVSVPIQPWLTTQLALHTGNPWIFRPGDLVDAAGFCAMLQAGTDPLS